MKSLISGLCLLLHLTASTTYIVGLSTGCLPLPFLRMLIWGSITFIMICIVIFDHIGERFNFMTIAKANIIVTGINAILVNSGLLIDNPYCYIAIYYIGTFMVSFMIYICAAKHGYFKQHYENA